MAKKKVSEESVGQVMDASSIRDLINKSVGNKIAFSLKDENPADVKYWIPTGSRILDSIICQGQKSGIPGGRVAEISSLSGIGKSYLAMQISKNAIDMGLTVLYFDSESAVNTTFLESLGMNLDRFIYISATSVEQTLETIEQILGQAGASNRFLFVIDSLANLPSKTDIEGDFDPQSSMAVKARILSKGFSKLITPLATAESTLLVLNQLKDNLSPDVNPKYAQMTEKYTTPGGKALGYAASLRIWLVGSKAKDSYVYDENNFKIGSLVKTQLVKSRFGTQDRQAIFKIQWGGDRVHVQDDESLFEVIKTSDYVKTGAWNTITMADGSEVKFQSSSWMEKMEDPIFKARVEELVEEELIHKFANRTGKAENFYNVEGDEKVIEETN